MITNNFKSAFFTSAETSGTRYFTNVSGLVSSGNYMQVSVKSALNLYQGNYEQLLNSSSYSASVFAFGEGTADETINDITFAQDPTQPISESNPSTFFDNSLFTFVNKSSLYNNNATPSITASYEFTYDGNTPITITEIGWFVRYTTEMALVAREVIEPITVNNGDTFTVSMVIG